MSDKTPIISDEESSDRTASPPTLTIDYAKYEALLDGGDLTAAEKRQVLDALWSIIVGFVDLGFRVHPLSEIAGEFGDRAETGAKDATRRDGFNLRAKRSSPRPIKAAKAGKPKDERRRA